MTNFEKIRVAVYPLLAAVNLLALTFGWYNDTEGQAILGVANTAVLCVATYFVPASDADSEAE